MGNNIKMYLKEIVYQCVNWIHLAQGGANGRRALVNKVMRLPVPENFVSR
jgi:hypothetical protein